MQSQTPLRSGVAPPKIDDLVETALARKGARLSFPPALEALFETEIAPLRRKQLFRGGLLAILIYNAFVLGDRIVVPDILHRMVLLRLLFATPVAAITLLIVRTSRSSFAREGSCALAVLAVDACLLFPLLESDHPNAVFCHPTILIAAIFGNSLLRIRFDFATLTSIFLVAGYSWVLHARAIDPPLQAFLVCTLASATGFALLSSHVLEKELRRGYLLSLRDRLRKEDLQLENQELSELARVDPLTGLANRREFDLRLALMARNSAEMGLIMIDVDHFKAFNDRFGHMAGDECLRGIGKMLKELTRDCADLAARFGGEEFAVLLPGSSLPNTLQVAERLRSSVRDLETSVAPGQAPERVSISAGVAAGRRGISPESLVSRADAALYEAKSEGRDRVCHWEDGRDGDAP